MPTNPTVLLNKLDLSTPLIGVYDAPDPAPFAPLVTPQPGTRACVFAFYYKPFWQRLVKARQQKSRQED